MNEYIDHRFSLPGPGENFYGWKDFHGENGESISQITRELAGFKFNGRAAGFISRYEHGLNLIRLLWPEEVKLYKVWTDYRTGERVVIWNHFFMRIFKALCERKKVALTGSGSSGKTYCVAVYALLMFMSDPTNTTIMVSTTAGTDAERRIWGEIKGLHARLESIYPVGTRIDSLKIITFDPGKEMVNKKDLDARDLGNGIMLIPIPRGQDGENALGKIIGTKQRQGYVIWIIDELPNMIENVLRPVRNLLQNVKFQLIGIGNANRKTDPHGILCEPVDGYESINQGLEEWEARGDVAVIFCNGLRSPNYHPAVDPLITAKDELPFPWLANRISNYEIAVDSGRGNVAEGERTIDYIRFAIGFWYGEDVSVCIISEPMIRQYGADSRDVTWGADPLRMIAGFDCGWTAGGDANELCISTMGRDKNGRTIVLLPEESFRISIMAQDREGFRTDLAKQVVDLCKLNKVKPEDFWMDTSGDGGLVMREIMKVWGTTEIHGLSSLEPPDNKARWANLVTQYWFQVPEAVASGVLKGFNPRSRYARDMFARQYESVGKGVVKVERKEDMKKRIHRSPDAGDSLTYCLVGVRRSGVSFEIVKPDPEENLRNLNRYILGPQSTDDGHISFDEASENDRYADAYSS